MPGILWQLIKAAPGVFVHGDDAPDSVREATEDLLDENDVARPFIEQCLVEDAGAITPLPEIEAAISKWIGGSMSSSDARYEGVLRGVKAKWLYGRKTIQGRKVRGLIGVRLKPSS
jgi:phage/plasmid-associated DNA primase